MNNDGFERLDEQTIPELYTRASLLRHRGTGAQVLSMANDDGNKVFGITFRTPPPDSSGIAHILEHTVLCGSRKYPLKDPFVQLVKGSLQTFLNAMTYPDKTTYPVASQNLKDFYNLIDVYLDAVFHPLLSKDMFQQEGWHFDLADGQDALAFKGVVYNEMKGVYSSPDSLIYEYVQQSLFPDAVYGLDSGGDPAHIPDLTYEAFREFHARFYHPSNARIFFYGDDPPEQRLALLAAYLDPFARIELDSAIAPQPAFAGPLSLSAAYAAGPGDAHKCFLTLNWLLGDVLDNDLTLAWQVMAHILIGTPASPLKKALIESGLGEDLTGVGLETELRQCYFSTGLKGIAESNADEVERLILDTLGRLVHNGLDRKMIEASMNTIEFLLRENNTGSTPRGLVVMLRALTTWLHDGDPMDSAAFKTRLQTLKQKIAGHERFFEDMIRRDLLDNPHRTRLLLRPDDALAAQREQAERESLDAYRRQLSAADEVALIDNTLRLREMQNKPDDPAALAAMPQLQCADLDPKNQVIPTAVEDREDVQLVFHDLFTNDILYLDLGLDLTSLSMEEYPYAAVLGRALCELGTENEDYVALTQRIGCKTGGIKTSFFTANMKASSEPGIWLFLRAKCMSRQWGDLLDILDDILTGVRLDNCERFRQIVLEEKADLESALAPSGHHMVKTRLLAGFNNAGWASEKIEGIDFLFFIRRLVHEIEQDWPGVLARMRTIWGKIVNRRRLVINVTAEAAAWDKARSALIDRLRQLPEFNAQQTGWRMGDIGPCEALTAQVQVNFIGKAVQLFNGQDEVRGSHLVINRYLKSAWLWDQVRVMGGAYGAFCSLGRRSGVISFVSYRDPHVRRTLDTYDKTVDYLRDLDLPNDELTRAIVGTIGDIDSYQLPSAKGFTALLRHLTDESDEDRQRMRDEVLATTAADFRAFADHLDAIRDKGRVVVLTSPETLAQADLGNGEVRTIPVM